MRKTSGRELVKQMPSLRPTIKVVYMSAYTNDEVLRRAVVEEGAAFVQKPFTVDSLVGKIREVLDTPSA